jgi:hypothetical protein
MKSSSDSDELLFEELDEGGGVGGGVRLGVVVCLLGDIVSIQVLNEKSG